MVLPADTCRLCASSGNRCVPVFGKEGNKNLLLHKLRTCSPVTVKETDKFPTQVCLNCLSSLDQTYDFYQQIKLAQHKLQLMVDEPSISPVKPLKRRFSDGTTDQDDTKRLCFGSTILTFSAPGPADSYMKNADKEDQRTHPPLFVTVKNSESMELSKHNLSKQENQQSHACQPENGKTTPTQAAAESKSNEKVQPIKSMKAEPDPSPKKTPAPKNQLPSSESQETNKSSPTASPDSQNVSTHNGEFKSCRHCQREFPVAILAKHEALHVGSKLYECDQCQRSFFSEEGFKRHIQRHERKPVSGTD